MKVAVLSFQKTFIVPLLCVNAIKLNRHTGMDCRYPEHREVNLACPPWPLGSGIPCRNDGFFLNLMAVGGWVRHRSKLGHC